MTERTIAEKLKYKTGMRANLVDVPDRVDLGVPAEAGGGGSGEADFVVVFASTQADAERRLRELAPALRDTTVAWVAYPKGSKAAGYDLNRDTVAEFARTVGLVVNANFSIDETWSALRVRPLRPGE
jgi:hypothetical protein